MKTQGNYIITGGEEGKARLHVLSEVLYPYEKALLQLQGVRNGTSFLDVGCGGGDVSMMVAGLVGDAGRVIGVDFDENIISLNRKEIAELGMSNIEFQVLSAYDMAYKDEFDMAFARFLLSHLTEPLLVLKNMVASVKRGGRVIVEDIHFSGHFCHPANESFDKYVSLFTSTMAQRGQNANIGPELYDLFRNAGLNDIEFDVIQPVFHTGPGKLMARITMDKIKEAVISQGLADSQEIQKMLDGLDSFTKDDTTIISLPRIFRVWGVRE